MGPSFRFAHRSRCLQRVVSRRTLLGQAGAGGVALATLGGMPAGIEAQATPLPGTQAPDESHVYRLTVGAIACTLVSDGTATFPNPPQLLFSNAPADALAAELREYGAPDPWPEWTTPFTPMLVENGGHRVLIDTGFGSSVSPMAGQLTASLKAAGVGAEEIDTVVLSHGHPDHIGGATDGAGNPAFPNARYVMARVDWDFWTDDAQIMEHVPDPGLQELMLGFAHTHLPPLGDRIELIELMEDGAEIAPGVRAIAAPGHSPGHLILEITSGDERLLYGADTVLHPIHMEHPDWLTVFDIHPEPTTSTRRRILDLAVRDRVLMASYHFPFPGLGRVTPEGDVWRWEPVGMTQ